MDSSASSKPKSDPISESMLSSSESDMREGSKGVRGVDKDAIGRGGRGCGERAGRRRLVRAGGVSWKRWKGGVAGVEGVWGEGDPQACRRRSPRSFRRPLGQFLLLFFCPCPRSNCRIGLDNYCSSGIRILQVGRRRRSAFACVFSPPVQVLALLAGNASPTHQIQPMRIQKKRSATWLDSTS